MTYYLSENGRTIHLKTSTELRATLRASALFAPSSPLRSKRRYVKYFRWLIEFAWRETDSGAKGKQEFLILRPARVIRRAEAKFTGPTCFYSSRNTERFWILANFYLIISHNWKFTRKNSTPMKICNLLCLELSYLFSARIINLWSFSAFLQLRVSS